MVAPEYAVRSKEIIAEFIATQQQVKPESSAQVERSPLLEKLRLLGEALLFCWIVPRKLRHRSGKTSPRNDADDIDTYADDGSAAPERKGNEES